MTGEVLIGPVQLHFKQQGHDVVMTLSGERETVRRIADESELIEGVEVPNWIEMTTSGGPEPDMHARVEVRDGSPVLTELSWKSGPGQSDIRRKHLRQTDIAKLVTDLVVSTLGGGWIPMGVTFENAKLRQAKLTAQRFVDRQRQPRERRVMTDEFLQKVALIYLENIDGNPTKAVGQTFNVQQRMASNYVDKARQKGYLPKTERGKKKAWT